jgi:integrase
MQEDAGGDQPNADVPLDNIVLPNAREVNQQISEQARAERERSRSARQRGARHWITIAEDAQKRIPNDVFRQFSYCLRVGRIPAGTGRPRNVGNATQTKFGTDGKLALKELRLERANVRNLPELGGKHVLLLVKRWLREGKSPATINGRVAALRKLLVLLGKSSAVPTGAAWKRLLRANGIDPAALRRSQIRVDPKSVSAQGLSPQQVIDRLHLRHRHERMWLRLQWQFGLRPRECAMLDPLESDRGDHLLVLHGAKANRKRVIKFSTNPERRAAQRAALDEAKALALEHPQWRLHSRDRNTKQALSHFYYLMRKAGITKAELGVIPYSLRHEFANLEFEEVSGLPAPVLRKAPPSAYAEKAQAVAAAEQHVVNQLGHSSKDKSGGYNSTVHAEARRTKRQRAALDIITANESLCQAVKSVGIEEAWLLGKAGAGDQLQQGDPFELALSIPKGLSSDGVLAIMQAVQTLPRPVTLSWCSARPDEALEVVFPHQR